MSLQLCSYVSSVTVTATETPSPPSAASAAATAAPTFTAMKWTQVHKCKHYYAPLIVSSVCLKTVRWGQMWDAFTIAHWSLRRLIHNSSIIRWKSQFYSSSVFNKGLLLATECIYVVVWTYLIQYKVRILSSPLSKFSVKQCCKLAPQVIGHDHTWMVWVEFK